jgi:glycosyltransferase involved in cell wall biosynthesis
LRGVVPAEDPDAAPAQEQRPRDRVPDAVLEQTNLGPQLDELVLRARRRMRLGSDPDDDLLYDHFDVLHYLLSAPRLMDRPRLDLLDHFLRSGEETGLSPDPDFSMPAYLARHPERAQGPERSPYLAWLKSGRDAGEIADPAPGVESMASVLGLQPDAVVDLLGERRRDLQQRLRTGQLGEMFSRAVEIEPLIGEAWPEIARPMLLPFTTQQVVDEMTALHCAHAAARFRPARLVFVINRARWGAGRRMEGHLAHALAAYMRPEEMVVLYTDDSTSGPTDRFPAGVREIDVATLFERLPTPEAEHALVTLIRTFDAEAVININSRMLYRAMRTYGSALAVSERVFLCFFCNEQGPMGTWRGWSLRYFYRLFDQVAGVFTDSEHLASELVQKHRASDVDQARIHVFSAPVDRHIRLAAAPPTDPRRRPQVFWAGRWDRQKRIELFLEIARLLPDVDFRMWGESVMGGGGHVTPPNVSIEGRYNRFSDLPLHEADLWLYTSGWDGVPSQLLEVAMTGVPLVGTAVGGSGEVLGPDDAWPIPEQAGADAYVTAIRAVLADPLEARVRARALRDRMLRDRTEGAFAAHAARILLGDGTKS